MQVCEGLANFDPPARGCVVTIGNFDGVHLGHRLLVETARRRATDWGVPVVVATFDPHPLAVVAPHHAPPRLTTLPERLALLERLGVDAAIVLRSRPALLEQSARQFLVELAEACRPRAIVEGPTFTFGRRREGTVETLRAYAARHGYEVVIVEELHTGDTARRPAINSSAIRAALRAGDVRLANEMLGRPYRIVGTVVAGDQRGRTIGFPTANLDHVPHLLPREAVYAAAAQLDNDELHLAAVNIGPQPTFEQPRPRVEAHLLGWSGELAGRRIGLHLLRALREQRCFANADDLVTQLRHDVEHTRRFAAEVEALRGEPPVPLAGRVPDGSGDG